MVCGCKDAIKNIKFIKAQGVHVNHIHYSALRIVMKS
jgi:hypothetical protein